MVILKRLATVVPTLIGVIVVTFLLTRVLPGDPAVYFAGPAATPQPASTFAPRTASQNICTSA